MAWSLGQWDRAEHPTPANEITLRAWPWIRIMAPPPLLHLGLIAFCELFVTYKGSLDASVTTPCRKQHWNRRVDQTRILITSFAREWCDLFAPQTVNWLGVEFVLLPQCDHDSSLFHNYRYDFVRLCFDLVIL